MIEITSEAIERAETLLAGIPKGAERAFSNAINRAVTYSKTKAFKEVRKVYAVKQNDLNSATAIRIQNANTGDIAGFVSFSGVNVSQNAPKKSKSIRAGLMKGSQTEFKHAFIAQMNSGHIGIFERTTSKRLPIEEIMGLSGAQMIQNEVIIDQLSEEAQEKVNERVMHEIDRILNGYGG